MKIQPQIFNFKNNNLQNQKSNNIENTPVRCNYNEGISPQEVVGRSLVNFQGLKKDDFELSKSDKRFVKYVTDSLHYPKEKAEKTEQVITDYLKKHKIKNLKAISGEKKLEDVGAMVDELMASAKMTDKESIFFIGEFTNIIAFKGNYKIPEKTYANDFKRLSAFADNQGIDPFTTLTFHHTMVKDAQKYGFTSTFDLFNGDIKLNKTNTYGFIKDNLGLKTEDMHDFILDIVKSPIPKEKVELPPELVKEKVASRMHNSIACQDIVQKFKLAPETADGVYDILAHNYSLEKPKDLKINQKMAFLIADEYNLPMHAEKEIIKILEHVQSLSPDAICQRFLKIFFK
ncbi:MAG: hypothetical protein LKG27_01515 [Clostridiaceae bacterium]|jgi:hypothetical protein|nr:hypothetical protein [Clostridiaceae bacterium]